MWTAKTDQTVKMNECPGRYESPLGARCFAGCVLLWFKYTRVVSKHCDSIKRVIQMKRADIQFVSQSKRNLKNECSL